MANKLYASGNFSCEWNGSQFTEESLSTGWGSDQFLTVTPNGDLVETDIGADGSMSVSTLADQGGVITMNFKQTAGALSTIDKISAGMQLMGAAANVPYYGVFTFVDPTGNTPNFVAWNAVLVSKGAHTHQKVMGERTVTWHCERLIYGDVDSILSAIRSYFKV